MWTETLPPACQSLAITLLFWGLAQGFSPFNSHALAILRGSHTTRVSHRNIKNILYFNCSFWSSAKLFLSNSHCSQISLKLSGFSLGRIAFGFCFIVEKMSVLEKPNSYITTYDCPDFAQVHCNCSAPLSLPIMMNLKGRQGVLDGHILCWEIIIQHT